MFLFGMCVEKFEVLVVDFGECVFVILVNLFDCDVVMVLFLVVEEKMGLVDIFVNNVGIMCDNIFVCMKDEEWN